VLIAAKVMRTMQADSRPDLVRIAATLKLPLARGHRLHGNLALPSRRPAC
jgi:hypothetical protein